MEPMHETWNEHIAQLQAHSQWTEHELLRLSDEVSNVAQIAERGRSAHHVALCGVEEQLRIVHEQFGHLVAKCRRQAENSVPV